MHDDAAAARERLLFADSELAAVQRGADGRWCLRFAAAAARRVAADGGADEDGWVRGALLWLEPAPGAAAGIEPGALFGRVRAGRVQGADGTWSAWLPIPMAARPALRLELTMAQGAELLVPLRSIALERPPGATFEASLAC